ncbi:protein RRP5 homolog [Panonychus citri]|uniref:protein RRP5 homolog n=1 Tax=Panonychus citri TaxID=50023 RepID=UPI0023072EBA|nr:protein RRP5 homolog [Panonychus citri]
MEDVDFPRGKYPTFKDSLAKKVSKRAAEDELFSTRILSKDGDDDGDLIKSSKKKKGSKSKKSTSDEIETTPGLPTFTEKIIIYRLKVTNVAIGSIILGCVTEIKDFEMSIQLPGAVMVKVTLSNISEPYNKSLAAYATDPVKNPPPPKPKSMFSTGDLLPVKILDKISENLQFDNHSMSLTDITASINPNHIYSDVNTNLFIKNCLHSSISAAVVEIEDNGYLMDIGKENIHGFLGFDEAKPFLESHSIEKLQIGQVLMCNIISASPRVVKLTTQNINSRPKIDDESIFPASCLLPGLQVTCKILGISDKGLEVVIYGQHRGFVHRDHLKTIWDLPRDDYTIGSEINGIILFVNPINKVSSISLRSPSIMNSLKKTWSSMKIGQLIEEAQIVGRDGADAFIFKFPNGFKGIAPKGELSDDYVDSEEFSIMEGQLPIGSTHKCRIKSFSYLDGYAKVTLKPSLLSEELLSVDNLSIGQVIEGRVKKLNAKGLILNIGFALKAICPPFHYKDSAKPKDYQAGSKITCRIIRLDTSSLVPKIAVTCRKELIRETNIIDDIDKAQIGTFTRGVVSLIKPNGLLVEFFNHLRGWLSATRLAQEGQQYIPSNYFVGQILPVYVKSRDLTTKQIHVSLTYNEDEDDNQSDSIALGTILTNLTVKEKDDNGFVLVNSEDEKFYLPKDQLTDFPALIDKIYQVIDETDTIDEVVVFNNTPSTPVVSRRWIFIHAAKIDNPVFKPDSLIPDLIVPAVIVNFKCYGIMVECPGGLIGLVPNTQISDPPVDPFEFKIPKGQTILVHINEVKNEEDKPRRLNCSTLIAKCKSTDFTPDTVLTSYLSDYYLVSSKLNVIENTSETRTLSMVKPGDVLSYKVVEAVEKQILVACSVPDRKKPVAGIIISSNIGGKELGKIGYTGEAAVLYIDIEKKLIHLTANQDIVKSAKSAIKANSYEKMLPGQNLIGLLQLTTDKYYIISLKGHAIGALAYIPRYYHLNQLNPDKSLLKDGQKLYFCAKINQLLTNGMRLIIGSKTLKKPTAVAIKEAQAAQAKIEKKKMKRLARIKANEKKRRKSGTEDDKENGDEDHENNEDEHDSGEEENSNDDDDDEDETNIKFFVDTKGNIKKNQRSRKLSKNEDDETSSIDSDGNVNDTDKSSKEKKRKRKVSENQEATKDAKKKHFRKIQSLLSTRVKSAVTDENEVFFWDTTGDPKLANKGENDETEATITLPSIYQGEIDDKESGPLTKEEFEKLIVESPNDIDRWCRFINFYLGQAEITKAKELCERALETIDHKFEHAKLRIWFLKLKIEYKYGSPETLSELITKALCANDELKVYSHLIALYEEDGKTELAEQTFREATKKHPLNKSLWVDFGRFYLKHDRVTSFRDLVQRAINYLEKKEQLDLIIKFAQLECQSGEIEKAKTMFEAALVNFPKRTDIWSIYIDMMIKYGLKEGDEGIIKRNAIESIRLLFDRATAIKIKEKKIRFLFNKYIEFERQYGDEEKIAAINKKMSEYVEANDLII